MVKWLDAKDDAIQLLKRRLAQQRDETKHQEEKVQELEEYIWIQEDYFMEQMSETELQTTSTQ